MQLKVVYYLSVALDTLLVVLGLRYLFLKRNSELCKIAQNFL
jgi:hypothetical protein